MLRKDLTQFWKRQRTTPFRGTVSLRSNGLRLPAERCAEAVRKKFSEVEGYPLQAVCGLPSAALQSFSYNPSQLRLVSSFLFHLIRVTPCSVPPILSLVVWLHTPF